MNKVPAVVGFIILLSLSGCLGLTSYESPSPVVNDETLQNTSYELSQEKNVSINQSVGNVTDIKVVSKMNRYEMTNEENTSIPLPNSQYVVLSTPSVSPVGATELNPIVLDPTDSTFDRVQGQVGGSIKLQEKVDVINITHSDGSNVTVDKHEGAISIKDVSAEFDATILSAVLERENAVIVTLSAYPDSSEDDQESKALEMIKNTRTLNKTE